jgi:hypothetical protein
LKKLVSVIVAAALTLGGLVALEAPASAADNLGVYPLNINSASAPGNAKEFTTYDGKLYFTADSLDHGRAIYTTSASNPSGATYFDSRAAAGKMGDPRKIFGFAGSIYYWDNPSNGWGNYNLYGKSTTGTGHFEVEAPSMGNLVVNSDNIYNFAVSGNKMYFFAADSATPTDYKLWSIDDSGNLTMVNDIDFTPGTPFTSSIQAYGYTQNVMEIMDGKIYVNSANSSWNTADAATKVYEIATDAWSNLQYNSSDLQGTSLMGKFRYNSQDVIIYGKRVNWNYTYYYVAADGVVHQLGNISTGYSGAFVNFGERLFFWNYPVFSEVSTTDASLTDMTQTLAPGATSLNIESAVETNGMLVMMARENRSETTVERIYKWDGTGIWLPVGNIAPVNNTTWLPEYPTTTGWGRNVAMGATGTGVVVNLYIDGEAGYEPYYVKLDGTTTLAANIDTGSDGSAPGMYCGGSSPTSDFVPASVTGSFGTKSVMSEFKQNGIYLDYEIYELPNLSGICGIASDGTYTYFKAYDQAGQHDAAFKMDANHVVTKLGDMSSYNDIGFAYNGNYFWLDNDAYNLFMTSSAGVETKLTGFDGALVRDGSVDEVVQVGTKLFFNAETQDSKYNLFSFDMATPTAAPVTYITNSGDNWRNEPRNLTRSGTKLYFTMAEPGSTEGTKVYSVDATNLNAPVSEFDVYSDSQVTDVVDSMQVIGSTFYLKAYDDNNSNTRWLIKRSGTEAVGTVVSLPDNFTVDCMATVGGELMVTNNQGVAKYLGDGSSTFRNVGINFSNNSWAPCDGVTSLRGSYFSYDEYTRSGVWGYEPAYLGTLIPRAVKRLGTTVNEIATPIDGTVQTAVPGPNTTVDVDDINLGTLDETKDFSGHFGSIVFPDGSGFTIDSKGNVKAKTKSIYLVKASGKIKFSYRSGTKTKSVTCNIKTFGSTKKVKTAFTSKKTYTSGTACKLSSTVVKAMKTGVVTVVQTLKVYRYYSTTMKAKTPTGAVIKAQNRKMTVRMGKLS